MHARPVSAGAREDPRAASGAGVWVRVRAPAGDGGRRGAGAAA